MDKGASLDFVLEDDVPEPSGMEAMALAVDAAVYEDQAAAAAFDADMQRLEAVWLADLGGLDV